MRMIAVWVAIAIVCGYVFLEYIVMVPPVERFQERVNSSSLNDSRAISTMDRHISIKDKTINIIPYLTVGVMLLWGFMWSQQRETYTGVY